MVVGRASPGWRLLRLDLPGFGDSPITQLPTTYAVDRRPVGRPLRNRRALVASLERSARRSKPEIGVDVLAEVALA